MSDKTLTPYIELAVTWTDAMHRFNPHTTTQFDYIQVVDSIINLAKQCQFPETLYYAKELKNKFDNLFSIAPVLFSASDYSDMKARLHSIEVHFRKEASHIEICFLSKSEDDKRFIELPNNVSFSDVQKQFHTEAIYCLRVSALRATIGISWQLCFDYFINWVLTDTARTDAMNTSLTSNSQFNPINSYDNYLQTRASERAIINNCEQQPLGENLYSTLKELLKTRNRYSHANDNVLNINKVRSFCDEVSDIIERLAAK